MVDVETPELIWNHNGLGKGTLDTFYPQVGFVELGHKFFRKSHYVLNYFTWKILSAISEGINNKIKRLKRMPYGYRDIHYLLLKIHRHYGLLNPKLSS